MADEKDPLREELDAGLRFSQLYWMQTKREVLETLFAVTALAEELAAKGMINAESFRARKTRIAKREIARIEDHAHVKITDNVDKYTVTDLPDIDCEARIPLCKARCCQMHFNLTRQDLDERIVQWDYTRPYVIRRHPDGYCFHNDEKTRGCTVYHNRPAICRTYDCRKDKRVWIDFENRIPAEGL
jgi:Fe-S-cluster containining protein